MFSNRIFRCPIVGLLVVLCCACQASQTDTALPVLPIGGDFALTDHNNAPFELASLRGKIVLVFFGFTYCPDACPTTLSKLAAVYRELGSEAQNVKTLYITVDPGRDTPEVLKAELSYFALDAIGLTGTKEEIDRVVRQYGAYYQILSTPDSAGEYTVTHTTTLYALDTSGQTRMTFPYEATVDEIVNGIRAIEAAGPAA